MVSFFVVKNILVSFSVRRRILYAVLLFCHCFALSSGRVMQKAKAKRTLCCVQSALYPFARRAELLFMRRVNDRNHFLVISLSHIWNRI